MLNSIKRVRGLASVTIRQSPGFINTYQAVLRKEFGGGKAFGLGKTPSLALKDGIKNFRAKRFIYEGVE